MPKQCGDKTKAMIESIAAALSRKIANLPFITLSGGIARQQQIRIGDRTKTIPACVASNESDYMAMVPNSKEVGISYFENSGNSKISEISGNRGVVFNSRLRLVVWLNLSRISPPDVGECQAQILNAVFSASEIDASIVLEADVPRSAEIFNRYTYDEAETQYLMLPYDYFAFDFQVTYTLKTCAGNTIQSQNPTC